MAAPPSAAAASTTVTDVANPDAYSAATCGRSGYIDFERLADGSNLSASAINGVHFTTTGGYTWRVGDFGTGQYNGKYPNGSYTSQGTHWAWLGENQGAGRIDFTEGPASALSLLVSDSTPVQLDAYDAGDHLIASAGPAPANVGTGHMSQLAITRDTADIAYAIVHDAGNYFLVDAICTNAPGVPQTSLWDFKQKNDDWARQTLFNDTADECWTVGRGGCAITAVADVIATYGKTTLPDGSPTNPGNLNQWLAKTTGTHSTCYLVFTTAVKLLGFAIDEQRTENKSLAERTAYANSSLAAGDLVIAGLNLKPPLSGRHYVVLYAQAGPGDYRMVDPDGKNGLLSASYGSFASLNPQIDVIHNKAAVPGRPWVIVGHSPIQFRVTDPSGAVTGWDPTSGTIVLGIDGSGYGQQPGLADDSDGGPASPETTWFDASDRSSGTYRVDVVGTGTGPYFLDFVFSDAPALRLAGMAQPGSHDVFLVTSPSSGSPAIARQVAIAINPGSSPPPFNLGKRGVIPVAVLSTPTFDARTISLSSITFGPRNASPTDRKAGVADVNGDGNPDIVVHFSAPTTGITATTGQACLAGRTAAGVLVNGCSAISIVPGA